MSLRHFAARLVAAVAFVLALGIVPGPQWLAYGAQPTGVAPPVGVPGSQGIPGPAATPALPAGTLLADPTILDPAYTGYVPISAAGDFEIGVRILVTRDGLVSTGARVGWVATAGSFNVRLWREGLSSVVASALNVAAPGSDGIVQVAWSTPVALTVGQSYIISTHDVANTTYVKGGVALAEAITTDYATHVGIWYPSGVGRRLYQSGHAPTMPSLDDGAASLQSIVVQPISQITSHYSGQTGVDLYQAVEWAAVPGATAYRLQVGSSQGGSDVLDTGVLVATGRRSRHVPGLAATTTYHLTVSTQIGGAWFSAADVPFTTGTDTGETFAGDPTKFLALVDRVRTMADANNLPIGGTVLYDIVTQAGGTSASCYQYVLALVEEAMAARLQGVTLLPVGFINNGTEVHEVLVSGGVVLDPTFDLVFKVSGSYGTAAQLSAATLAKNWGGITWVTLGQKGRAYAQSYYLDYPLLYLENPASAAWQDPSPYLSASLGTTVTAPTVVTAHTPNGGDYYIVSGGTTGAGQVTCNGVPQATTNDAHGLSGVVYCGPGQILAITAGGGTLKRPLRYVF